MAVGKRRTRAIVVGQRRFRWRCDFNDPWLTPPPDSDGPTGRHRLLVRLEDAPNKLLTVSCRAAVITPGFVQACIARALEQGWLASHPRLELEE
jgi:hypothetical protein